MPSKKEINKHGTWTFLTNHCHVLICLVRDPNLTLREVAALIGITERAVQHIVHDLVEDGYISITKQGRRNTYQIDTLRHLRHPVEKDCQIGTLIALLK